MRLDRPLTRLETLRFHLHRTTCSLCHPLPRQFEHLRALARSLGGEESPGISLQPELDEETRLRIQSALEKAAEDEPPQTSEGFR